MDSEEAEEGAVVVEAEVFKEVEGGVGSDREDQVALRKLVFALIAERLHLIIWDFLVFKQDVHSVVHL